jgi:hypothetical protein
MQKIVALSLLFLLAACGSKDQCGSQADCADNSACTEDICSAGQCQNPVISLDDSNACTDDACDPATGISHTPLAGLDDDNQCTTDACDPADGSITHTPLAGIDDDNACTADSCDPSTGVVSHDPININDNNACTTDSCNPITGVSHIPLAGIDDDNACTADSCDPITGVVSHPPLAGIDDNNQCTSDACDPSNGNLTHIPLAAINDNDACTTDACNIANGSITHTPLAGIDDNVACTIDACNSVTGNITHLENDALCTESDGATCTLPSCDTAQGCVEQPIDLLCSDSQACTTADLCDPTLAAADPITGCAFTIDGTVCDDTVDCTDDACTPNTGCSNVANNDNCSNGEVCDLTADCIGNVDTLTQGVITEFVALGVAGNIGELIELHNPGVVGDLNGGTITNAAGQTAIIHPVNNPTGSGLIVVPAGGFVFGVPNPSDPGAIPNEATFVYGDPGTTFEINDTGDNLVLRNNLGSALDEVNFVGNFITNPDTQLSASAFPGFAGASTQLDLTHLNTADNGNGANWCTTFRLFDTAGAPNLSCAPNTVVINELVYDGAQGANTNDPRKTFIELAGPGGTLISDLRVRFVETDGAAAGTQDGPNVRIGDTLPGARMPADGLFVIADNTGGDNQAVPANQRDLQADFDPENDSQAVQLLQEISGNLNLIDALAYIADATDLDALVDNLDGLSFVETTPALDANQGISLARNIVSLDTNNNGVDFVLDPSPSPGAINQPVLTTIASIFPNDGLATVTTPVVITGTDLSVDANIVFAGVAVPVANCVFDGAPTLITCNIPPSAAATRGDVVYTNTADRGGSTGNVFQGWTYTGALSETNVAAEADFCNIQFPFTTTTAVNTPSELIFGQIFEDGLTNVAVGFPAANILADIGFGPLTTNPTTNADWLFSSATFNVESGFNNNNDEYKATLTIPTAGTFSFVYRFSIDGGVNFTYCDQNGAGANGGLDFEATQLGTIIVQ